ncbi:MAG TPA: hypothetical protein RMH85_33095 [Polyangiaceae bacterium LLY-WYZ-15_(1-7)]|nr:hypothetical protein [Myxococcales bacterium]MBJ69752.1 hypothetical protein [Sandaracinus sp.]HJL02138.1 hypothetical protein [Polyangiaceae bacterium LLY-WYZ-15_(1-7)]HJL13366.1 hypothetical protein [Polyangiaceae bacterium LLY-WYZ-15_(1-7)]HJL25302.1 hypothetical protein [Polyangiaceae bacterium LLY-WYZ-15_(1-7)]
MREPEAQERPGARATFMLALFLTLMGTCGVSKGATDLRVAGVDFSSEGEQISPEGAPAAEQLAELQRTLYNDPNRRPLAAANIVVSLMLIIGSFLLTSRRPSAIWWLKQAVLANVVWIVAKLASWLFHSYRNMPELLALLESQRNANGPIGPEGYLTWMVVGMVLVSLVNLVAHVFVGWRVSREDIQRFLSGGTPS